MLRFVHRSIACILVAGLLGSPIQAGRIPFDATTHSDASAAVFNHQALTESSLVVGRPFWRRSLFMGALIVTFMLQPAWAAKKKPIDPDAARIDSIAAMEQANFRVQGGAKIWIDDLPGMTPDAASMKRHLYADLPKFIVIQNPTDEFDALVNLSIYSTFIISLPEDKLTARQRDLRDKLLPKKGWLDLSGLSDRKLEEDAKDLDGKMKLTYIEGLRLLRLRVELAKRRGAGEYAHIYESQIPVQLRLGEKHRFLFYTQGRRTDRMYADHQAGLVEVVDVELAVGGFLHAKKWIVTFNIKNNEVGAEALSKLEGMDAHSAELLTKAKLGDIFLLANMGNGHNGSMGPEDLIKMGIPKKKALAAIRSASLHMNNLKVYEIDMDNRAIGNFEDVYVYPIALSNFVRFGENHTLKQRDLKPMPPLKDFPKEADLWSLPAPVKGAVETLAVPVAAPVIPKAPWELLPENPAYVLPRLDLYNLSLEQKQNIKNAVRLLWAFSHRSNGSALQGWADFATSIDRVKSMTIYTGSLSEAVQGQSVLEFVIDGYEVSTVPDAAKVLLWRILDNSAQTVKISPEIMKEFLGWMASLQKSNGAAPAVPVVSPPASAAPAAKPSAAPAPSSSLRGAA